MLTIGIDLHAQPAGTAACLVEWHQGVAEVTEIRMGVNDDTIVGEMVPKADKVGIDAPFGWPTAFVSAVASHTNHTGWPVDPESECLRFRKTDIVVHDTIGRWPLSVSTTLIGAVALRAAKILSECEAGIAVDRRGTGKLVEVYPGLALRRWGLDVVPNKSERPPVYGRKVITWLCETAPWLEFVNGKRTICTENEHAADALVAALVARAVAIGLCEDIPDDLAFAAACEGWIAIPKLGSLLKLLRS